MRANCTSWSGTQHRVIEELDTYVCRGTIFDASLINSTICKESTSLVQNCRYKFIEYIYTAYIEVGNKEEDTTVSNGIIETETNVLKFLR